MGDPRERKDIPEELQDILKIEDDRVIFQKYPKDITEARKEFRYILVRKTGLSSKELDRIPFSEFHRRFVNPSGIVVEDTIGNAYGRTKEPRKNPTGEEPFHSYDEIDWDKLFEDF